METMVKVNPYRIGLQGEKIVFSLLPNAKWANNYPNYSNDYDILWNGIKINVKSSTLSKHNTAYIFSLPKNREGIFVFVGIDEDRVHFWVKKDLKKTSFYASFKESITADQLQEEILNANN